MKKSTIKPLEWVGSSKKDLLAMPPDVVDVFGYALHLAQHGGIATPKQDLDLIRVRLTQAQQHAQGAKK